VLPDDENDFSIVKGVGMLEAQAASGYAAKRKQKFISMSGAEGRKQVADEEMEEPKMAP